MAKQYNNVVRLEKRSTNKIGLFFLIIIFIAGAGYGGFYLYKHRSEIDWDIKIPWQNEEHKNKNNTSTSNNNNNSNKHTDLNVPSYLKEEIITKNGTLKFSDTKIDDKGYTIQVEYKTQTVPSEIRIEKVLVNGYETSSTLTIGNDDNTGDDNSQQTITKSLRILATELIPLKITGIKNLTIYYREIGGISKENLERKTIKAENLVDVNAGLKGLIEFYNKNQTTIYYYQTITDQDNTYIYFDAKNSDVNTTKEIRVKKLLINGELYEYKDLNFNLYRGAENIFMIEIPKKKIKKVENFTVSFFILAKEDDELAGVYITNEYSNDTK